MESGPPFIRPRYPGNEHPQEEAGRERWWSSALEEKQISQ